MINRLSDKLYLWLTRLSKTRSRQGLNSFLSDEYAQIPSKANVLLIGSGGAVNDLLDKYAAVQDFKVVSFDIDSRHNPDILGDICTHDFKCQTFDIVVASEVIEHLHSPHLGVQNIHRCLCDGGRLILSTPFILPVHDQPCDYFRFTRYGLAFLLRDFREVQILERNSCFEAIDVLWLRLVQAEQQSARLGSILLVPIVYFLKRPITLFLGKFISSDSMTTGYVVTAVK